MSKARDFLNQINDEYKPSNPKIDLFVDGEYHSSTNWSKTNKDAIDTFKKAYPKLADKKITAMQDKRKR